jgi:PmbA protein
MSAAMEGLATRAQQALSTLRSAGYAQAQVRVVESELSELNIAHNAPSLLRSTLTQRVQLVGLLDGRRNATDVGSFDEQILAEAARKLFEDGSSSPSDPAHSLPAQQRGRLVQGPQAADADVLAAKVQELLDWRAAHTPSMRLQEGAAEHRLTRTVLLNTEGSEVHASVGADGLSAFGAAHDGQRSSSFAFAGGHTHSLAAAPAHELFGIGRMMQEAVASTQPQRIAAPFDGEVVLAPEAVTALLAWLLSQLGSGNDAPLVAGSSMFLKRVGEPVAVPGLALHSRFDAPGVCALSAEGDLCGPVAVVEGGVLRTLLASRYASAKTGLPRVPNVGGWQVSPGSDSEAALVAGVVRGALVGRLSMGMPASNGNFSGVIKNSFLLEDGRLGAALSETMVSGNVAQMLQDISGIGSTLHDSGAWAVPWIRVRGMHFS